MVLIVVLIVVLMVVFMVVLIMINLVGGLEHFFVFAYNENTDPN